MTPRAKVVALSTGSLSMRNDTKLVPWYSNAYRPKGTEGKYSIDFTSASVFALRPPVALRLLLASPLVALSGTVSSAWRAASAPPKQQRWTTTQTARWTRQTARHRTTLPKHAWQRRSERGGRKHAEFVEHPQFHRFAARRQAEDRQRLQIRRLGSAPAQGRGGHHHEAGGRCDEAAGGARGGLVDHHLRHAEAVRRTQRRRRRRRRRPVHRRSKRQRRTRRRLVLELATEGAGVTGAAVGAGVAEATAPT